MGEAIEKGVQMVRDRCRVYDEAGITHYNPSICVRGEHEGEGHAWSQVYYDNAWHFFDVTFDMCSTKNGKISYNSFERSDEPEKYKAWEVFPLPK